MARLLLPARARAFEPRLDAGAGLSRASATAPCAARSACTPASQRGVGGGQRVGGDLRRSRSASRQRGHQLVALRVDHRRARRRGLRARLASRRGASSGRRSAARRRPSASSSARARRRWRAGCARRGLPRARAAERGARLRPRARAPRLGFAPARPELRLQILGRARCGDDALLRSRPARACASDKLFLGARPRAETAASLRFRLALLPLDGGEQVARLAPACPAPRARAGAGAVPRPAALLSCFGGVALGVERVLGLVAVRACGLCASSSDSRLRSASRCAAGVDASAAATNPSHRHRSPSRETSRWPGFKGGCRRAALSRPLDDADLAQAAVSSGGASTCVASGSTPAGSAGSSARHLDVAPVHGALPRRPAPRDRRPAPRRAPPRSPARRAGDRGSAGSRLSPRADQQLGQRLALGVQRWPGAARRVALRRARVRLASATSRDASSAASACASKLAIWSGSCWPALGDLRQLLGVRRAAGDLARLRVEARRAGARAWRRCLWRSASAGFEALLAGAMLGGAWCVSSAKLGFGLAQRPPARLELRARVRASLVAGLAARPSLERLDFGVEADQDLPCFARSALPRAPCRRRAARRGPPARAARSAARVRLALEVVLLDLEAGRDGGALACFLRAAAAALRRGALPR